MKRMSSRRTSAAGLTRGSTGRATVGCAFRTPVSRNVRLRIIHSASPFAIQVKVNSMSWFKSNEQRLTESLLQEQAYARATEELMTSAARPGIWAKAAVEARGDDTKTHTLYLKFRVEQILLEQQVAAEKLAIELAKPPPKYKCRRCHNTDIPDTILLVRCTRCGSTDVKRL